LSSQNFNSPDVLDVDEKIINDSDHGSENVANILLDLSTSEIPVMKIEKGR
jgi:hypothetical protein